MDSCIENVIEWIRDQDRATLTLSQRRTITRVKKACREAPGRMPDCSRKPGRQHMRTYSGKLDKNYATKRNDGSAT